MPNERKNDPVGKPLYIAAEMGFCSGVRRALALFDELAAKYPPPVYIFHELVHNRRVSEKLSRRGGRIVNTVEAIPPGAVVLLGAHGVTPEEKRRIGKTSLVVSDAICPVIAALHKRIAALPGTTPIILLGNAEHDEVKALRGVCAPRQVYGIGSEDDVTALPPLQRPALVAQTTWDDGSYRNIRTLILKKYPDCECFDSVCPVVIRRQRELRELACRGCPVLIVGSPHSANTTRMRDLARSIGVEAHIVEDVAALRHIGSLGTWQRASIASGTSADSADAAEIIKHLTEKLGFSPISAQGLE